MAGGFHPLRVADVERLTEDSVALTFAVPPELREAYRYTPGQHIAVRIAGSGGEVRRTYSLCAPAPAAGGPGPATLRVGVRLVPGGEFSTLANKELAPGDTLDVMTPAGRFTLEPRPGRFAAVAGGSGITPVLSLASTVLAQQPEARFCLVRCDRTAASAMFLEETADLKDRYPDRFQLVHILTREELQAGLPSGRVDAAGLTALLPALVPVDEVDGWYLCGPWALMTGAATALRELGVARARVHQEVFHAEDTGAVAAQARPSVDDRVPGGCTVTAKLDGRAGSWPAQDGEAVLDTVLRNRADAPYACKGGVCGTCRAFLVSGTVRMDRNFALEPDEVTAGYVLACQAHPTSEDVQVDFDR